MQAAFDFDSLLRQLTSFKGVSGNNVPLSNTNVFRVVKTKHFPPLDLKLLVILEPCA